MFYKIEKRNRAASRFLMACVVLAIIIVLFAVFQSIQAKEVAACETDETSVLCTRSIADDKK